MESTQPHLLLVCVISFLQSAKPSEPHLVQYLTQVKGFTEAEVLSQIFPWLVYAAGVFTALVAPGVHLLGYKNCILLGAMGRVLTRLLLLYGTTLAEMVLMQVMFGLAMASDIVMSAYLYSLVPPAEFLRLTALVSACGLLGYVLAAELSQLMLWLGCGLTSLFYVSAVTVGTSAVLSLWLRPSSAQHPRVKDRSAGLLATDSAAVPAGEEEHAKQPACASPPLPSPQPSSAVQYVELSPSSETAKIASAGMSAEQSPLAHIALDSAPFRPAQAGALTGATASEDEQPILAGICPAADSSQCSPQHDVVTWLSGWSTAVEVAQTPRLRGLSIWWVLCVGPLMSFTENYSTNLFYEVRPDVDENGHVVAMTRLCMSAAALAAPLVFSGQRLASLTALLSSTAVVGAMVVALGRVQPLWAVFGIYAGVMSALQLLLTYVHAESARLLTSADFSTLFGLNSTLTLILQCAAQAVLTFVWPEHVQSQYVAVGMCTTVGAICALAFTALARTASGAQSLAPVVTFV